MERGIIMDQESLSRDSIALENIANPSNLARHGSMMVIFGLVAGGFNYLYQVLMGVMLTPEEYGTLFSLISLIAIAAVFSQTFQTSAAKYTSKFKTDEEWGRIKYLWRSALNSTLLFGVGLFILMALFTPLISRFLHIDNYWYCIIVFASLILAFALPVNQGVLLGLQRFLPLGLSTVLMAVLKVGLGGVFVYVGLGIGGGLLPLAISGLLVFIVTFYFLKDLKPIGDEKCMVGGFISYTALACLAIFSFAVLTNADVILAKHYLGADEAGHYSIVSVLGRVAFFLPMGIAIAMFPKTSDLFESGGNHFHVLQKAFVYTLLLGGVVVAIFWLLAGPIVDFFFHEDYSVVASCVPKYGAAMLLFALVLVVMYYLLSLNQTLIGYPLLGMVILELVLVALFHSSVFQIVNIMLIVGVVSLLVSIPFLWSARKCCPS